MNITFSPTLKLNEHKFILLTTFRKNGKGISTPVTFAPYQGHLYVVTGVTSGKVKRLRNNPLVEFAPSDSRGNVLGASLTAKARILTSEEVAKFKPHLQFRAGNILMFFFNLLRDIRQGGNVYLEIV